MEFFKWENLLHLARFPQGTMVQGFELRAMRRRVDSTNKVQKKIGTLVEFLVGESDPSCEVPTGNDGAGIRTPRHTAQS